MDLDAFRKRVGRNVRVARWEAGLTLEELAAKTMTFRLLGELERGRGNPTLETLYNLARALDVRPSDLLLTVAQAASKASPPKRGRKPALRTPRSK